MNEQKMERVLVGIAVGAGIAIVGFFAAIVQTRREMREKRHMYDDRIHRLEEEIANLCKEEERRREKRKNGRRRRRKDTNGYDSDTTCSTMFTAYDSDQDEFFDISDDENEGLSPFLQSEETDDAKNLFLEVDQLLKRTSAALGHSQEEALQLLLSKSEQFSSNPNFLWRLAQAYKYKFDAAVKGKESEESQLKYIFLGLNHAKKAIELDDKNGHGYKWFAILTGLKSDFLPLKEKIANAILFHKHLCEALERLPNDWSLYHLLARFKYEIAALSWFERRAAKMLGDVPEVTMEEAIADASKAEELNTEPWIDNRILLAKAHIQNGNSSRAREWLNKAKLMQTQDEKIRKEIMELEAKC